MFFVRDIHVLVGNAFGIFAIWTEMVVEDKGC